MPFRRAVFARQATRREFLVPENILFRLSLHPPSGPTKIDNTGKTFCAEGTSAREFFSLVRFAPTTRSKNSRAEVPEWLPEKCFAPPSKTIGFSACSIAVSNFSGEKISGTLPHPDCSAASLTIFSSRFYQNQVFRFSRQ